jgi:hypothetical protein
MKNTMITLFLTAIAILGQAQANTTVLHVTAPERMGESYEVLTSESATPLTVNPSQLKLVNKLHEAERLNAAIEVKVIEDELIDITILEEESAKTLETALITPMHNYEATNIESMELVEQMFKTLKDGTKWWNNQCFNRAYIWAKQMYNSNEIRSKKIFIFYTKKYRREINKKWWFHVAPMVEVNGEDIVLDKEFMRTPVTRQVWLTKFTEKMAKKGMPDYQCSIIENMNDFYEQSNQDNEYCNVFVTSMYYRAPIDMSNLANKGVEKNKWSNREIKAAAKNILWKWKRTYRSLKVNEKN